MADDSQIIPRQIGNGGGGAAPTAGGVRAPDYRQVVQPPQVDEFGIYRASREDAMASEARARALTDAFDQFDNVTQKVSGILGQRAGQKAVAAGQNPTPMSGLAALTSYGQGYNNAVHADYEMSSKLSIENHLADIESKTQGDPVGYQNQANGVIQGALKAMPEPFKSEMVPWINARVQAGVIRQQQQKADQVRNQALATYESATPELISGALHTAAALPGPQGDAVIAKLVSDDQDRINALVTSHTITPEQGVAMHQKMVAATDSAFSGQKVDISLQPILNAMRGGNVEAADKMILQDDPQLSSAQNAARLQEYDREREEWEKAQTRAYAGQLADVHAQLTQGKFGQQLEGQLRDLYNHGALTQEAWYSAQAEALRNQKKQIGDDASIQMVDAVLHGEHPGPLDPENKAEAHAVDLYFQRHVAISGNVSPDQYASGAAEITRQTGILPASVAAKIRVGLISGDPAQTAQAAALAARIESVNPRVDVFQKSPRLAALAGMVNANLQAGLPAAQAYQLAVRTADIPPEQRKIRDASYAQALKAQGPNSDYIQKALGHEASGFLGFKHSLPVPISMQAEFDGLTRQFYDQTGSLPQARELAAAQLQKTWGPSNVNGTDELMKYPPPAGMVPTIRSDIAAHAKEIGFKGDPSTLHLTPNGNTDATRGRSWSVTYVDPKTGVTDVLMDQNHRPLAYHLPTGPDFVAARQRLFEQGLARARAERAADRKNTLDQNMYEQQLADEILRGNRLAGR